MTVAPPRRDLRQPPDAGPEAPPPRLGISLVQVLAAALAAATAAIAASFLGVAGTVIGAALASVISVTGTAVYSHSLRHTGHRMRQRAARAAGTATRPLRLPEDRPPLQGPAGRSPFDRPTLSSGGFAQPTYYGRPRTSPSPTGDPSDTPRIRSTWRRLAVAVVAVFAAVLAVLTGVEVLAGQPISDLVQGGNGTGTTLFGTHHAAHTAQKTHHRSNGPRNGGPDAHRHRATSAHTPTALPSTAASSGPSAAPSPVPPSSTAAPSTSSAPTASPSPSLSSGTPAQGSARSASAQP